MPYALLMPLVGVQQIAFNTTVDSTARVQPGSVVAAIDPFWGGAEFIYFKASAAIRQNAAIHIAPAFDTTTNTWTVQGAEVGITPIFGTSIGVAQMAMASGDFGWALISGLAPVFCTNAVTVGNALQLSATTGALRSVVATTVTNILAGAECRATSSTSVSHIAVGSTSQSYITVNTADGWFPGVVLTGSGLTTSTAVASIDSDNRTVRLTLANSAAVNGSVAAHYNNSATYFYNVLNLARPVVIGRSLGPIDA